MDYEDFLDKHKIFDSGLRERLIKLHIKTEAKGRYNSMYGKSVINSFSLDYDSTLFSSLLQYAEFLVKGEKLKQCEICNCILRFDRKVRYCEMCKERYAEIHRDEVKERRKKTCLERFGCEFPNQCEDIQNKTKSTNAKRYGCECALQNAKVHEKTVETNLKRYGCRESASSETVKEKVKETFRKKYGVDNPMKLEENRNKLKTLLKERHGVESPLQLDEFKRKRNETMLQKYGTLFVRDDEQYKKSCMVRYGFTNPKIYEAWLNVNSLDDVIPLFSKEDFKGNDNEYRWKCKRCGTEFFATYDDGKVKKLCPKCYVGSSKFEDEIVFKCIN